MKHQTLKKINVLLALALFGTGAHAAGADKELLDILLKNGAINKAQHSSMSGKEGLASSELLDVLSKNGTITKDQYAKLSQKIPAPVAAPAPVAVAAKPVEKDSASVKLSEKGLEFESSDGNFKAKIGGRLQVDSQINWNDSKGPAGTNLDDNVGFRRARIYTEGTLYKDFDYRFEYDFARNNGGTQGITDAFIKYTAFKPFALTIGQLNEGKSMESVMSNNYLTFIERSLPNNAFMEAGPASKYQLGIMGEAFAKAFDMPYTVRGGLTTESIGAPAPGNSSLNTQGLAAGNGNNANRNNASGNISYQLVGRTTLAPYKDKDGNLLHIGAWGSWRSINNNYNADGSLRSGGWRFVSQPGTGMDRTNWMDTKNLTGGGMEVNNIAMFGAELAGALGPAHFSAEYMRADISGKGYDNDDVLEGFYAYAGYFLTGETRPYDEKKGVWGRLSPKQNFIGGGGLGAWEVAARYDNMDMNTSHINGGSVGTGTLALNWYLNSHIRLMTNWVHVFNASTANAGACTPAGQDANHNNTNASLGCFNGLSPDIWETAVRFDY